MALPGMKARRFGRVVNVTTSMFTMLRGKFHPYGPSKAALEALGDASMPGPVDRYPEAGLADGEANLGSLRRQYNEALDRVTDFLEAVHFYDPLHGEIYDTATKLIQAGKQATPVTLKTFFENAEAIAPTPIEASSMV